MKNVFYLPGFVERESLVRAIIEFNELDKKNGSLFFKDNIELASYGCFPACSWNGGRPIFGEVHPACVIRSVFEWYKNHNVKLQLTFTNSCLNKYDIYDRYANKILDIGMEYSNVEFKVGSQILEEYILSIYPEAKLVRSIKPRSKSLEGIEHLTIDDFKKYNGIVLPTMYNFNKEAIKKYIEIGEKTNTYIEILVNHCCIKECKAEHLHLSWCDRTQLFEEEANPGDEDKVSPCKVNGIFSEDRGYYTIPFSDIDKYNDIGVHHFKLRERAGGTFQDVPDTFIECVQYLVKDPQSIALLAGKLLPRITEARPTYIVMSV